MKAFVVCLYDWDYQCDRDVIVGVLGVYDTLEKAVQFSLLFPIYSNNTQIEIAEFDGSLECGRYAKNGKKMD